MPEVRIIAKNFMDMVASMPAMKLDKLYENGFICEAILRSLPPLAKKYVLQLLHIDDAQVSARLFAEWVLPDGLSKHKVAIDRLVQLRLFVEALDSGTLPRESMPSNITVMLPTLEDLETHALEQWEIPHLRPTEYKRSRLSRNRRTVNRAYGRVLSGGAVRERIIRDSEAFGSIRLHLFSMVPCCQMVVRLKITISHVIQLTARFAANCLLTFSFLLPSSRFLLQW